MAFERRRETRRFGIALHGERKERVAQLIVPQRTGLTSQAPSETEHQASEIYLGEIALRGVAPREQRFDRVRQAFAGRARAEDAHFERLGLPRGTPGPFQEKQQFVEQRDECILRIADIRLARGARPRHCVAGEAPGDRPELLAEIVRLRGRRGRLIARAMQRYGIPNIHRMFDGDVRALEPLA